MTQSYETGRASMARLGSKQPHELLLSVGAALVLLLTLVLFGIEWYRGIADSQLPTVTTGLVLNVVLGAALWVAANITRKNLMGGAIVGGAVSLVLLLYGGQPGMIGGLVGLLGAILAAATPYLPWSESK